MTRIRQNKAPRNQLQADLLIEADNRCLYCGLEFGTLVVRNGMDYNWLEVNFDHFVPLAYAGVSRDDNWVVCCHLCNRYKGSFMFDSVEEVRCHVIKCARKKRHDPMPAYDLSPAC